MKVGILPYCSFFSNNRLFEVHSPANRDHSLQVWHDFRESCVILGWDVQTVDDPAEAFDVYLVLDPHREKLRKLGLDGLRRAVVQFFEPPDVRPEQYTEDNLRPIRQNCGAVLCYNRQICDRYGFEHHPWYVDLYPQREGRVRQAAERNGICMIAANKFSQHAESQLSFRLSMVKAICRDTELRPHFCLYGKDWLRATGVLREYLPRSRHGKLTFSDKVLLRVERVIPWNHDVKEVYRGVVQSKQEVLSNSRFNLIFENMYWDGYVTEKIFDALQFGCVPIYFGASDVQDYIPEELFINGRSFSEPLDAIHWALSLDESELDRMIQAGQDWLHSPGFSAMFGREDYIRRLQEALTLQVDV